MPSSHGSCVWYRLEGMTLIPMASKAFFKNSLTSGSSLDIIWSLLSTRWTSVPTALKILANSHPITPAPSISILFGEFVRLIASSLVIIVFPSIVMLGRILGRVPVAIIMCSPENSFFPTIMLCGSLKVACPLINFTLRRCRRFSSIEVKLAADCSIPFFSLEKFKAGRGPKTSSRCLTCKYSRVSS